MKKAFHFCLFYLFTCSASLGQFQLVECYLEMSGNQGMEGNGLSLVDFDKDGWDDITLCDQSIGVRAFKNMGDGTFTQVYFFATDGEPKCPTWVDYNNDGLFDLFFTCSWCSNQLHRNNGDGTFTDLSSTINMATNGASSQGCSWGDYDRDGLLDLYVCNYNNSIYRNWLFHNNGDDTFSELAVELGVDNGYNATFQSVWIDLNQDGWQDLYIVNDRHDVNQLYLNNEGSFVNASVSSGLNAVMNSMCNTVADHDNDGDFDFYITNTEAGNFLMKNFDGVFENFAVPSGTVLYSDFAWASLWMDYDLDGDDDLHVCTAEMDVMNETNYLLLNEGDCIYTPVNGQGIAGDDFISYNSAKADFNNDGLWDFITVNQLPASISVWQGNEVSAGNFLKIGLVGTLGNTDAVGAIIKAYAGIQQKTISTHCGENYLSQDSQYEIIGLGDATMVDSLIIHWPLGWVDKYYNLGGDQFYSFTEGETYLCEIVSSTGNQLCTAGGSLTLSAGEHLSYVWSDASTSSYIDVNAAGIYEVIVTNEYGLQATTTFEVVYYNELEVEISTQQPLCAASSDGTISIIADDEQVTNILWSNEQSGLQLQNLSQGEYTYQLTDMNGCEYENTIILADPAPVVASVTAENILCNGGTTELSAAASGGTGAYTLQWSLSDPTQAPAGEHSLTVTDTNGCSALHIITLDEPSLIVIDNNTQAVCNGEYTAADVSTTGGTGALQQNWNGVDETQLFAGDYSFTVTDANGCATTSVITIVEYAALAVTTTITDANEGNNGSILLGVTGGVEPYTFYWSNGATGNPLEGIGQGFYTCTITDGAGCVFYSENCQLTDMNVEEWHAMTHVFPNPFTNQLIVETIGTDEVMIYDATGRLMLQKVINKREQMDTTAWPSGVYFIHLGNALYSGMCVKE